MVRWCAPCSSVPILAIAFLQVFQIGTTSSHTQSCARAYSDSMQGLQLRKSAQRCETFAWLPNCDAAKMNGLPRRLSLRGGASVSDVGDMHECESAIIGKVSDFGRLERFYAQGDENTVFRSKLQTLKEAYSGLRAVKGDGNCFIRGYIFGVMESFLTNRTEASGFQGLLTGYYFVIIDKSKGMGYSSLAIEDFYQDVQNQLSLIAEGVMTHEMLVDNFNTPSVSNAVVFWFRLVCSCYLRQHANDFAPFLSFDGGPDVIADRMREYCLREVEPLESEVEHTQIMALTSAVGIGVRVAYLDRSPGPLNYHSFPETAKAEVHMLYRPGHYDLIYPK